MTYPQIAEAIRILNLEPRIVVLNNDQDRDPGFLLRSIVYAYLSARIPILLGVDLFAVNRSEDGNIIESEVKSLGHHGVAVTGFSFADTDTNQHRLSDYMDFRSERIEKLFVHDDQVGPFARMNFCQDSFGTYLSTSWKEGGFDEVVARYTHVVVPLYHKIRIPLKQVLDIISDFNEIPSAVNDTELSSTLGVPWTWDIRLSFSNEVKSEVAKLNDDVISPSERVEILTQSLPKYLWRATAIDVAGEKKIDLLFDATDIVQGESLSRAIEYLSLIHI